MRPKKVTEQDLLKHALRLTESSGFDRLSLHRLSDQLGIKPASLYNHITGLADLKKRIGIEAKRLFLSQTEERVGNLRGQAGLEALMGSYVAFAEEHAELFYAMIQLPDENAGPNTDYETSLNRIFLQIVEEYRLAKTEADQLRRALREMARGYFMLDRANSDKELLKKRNKDALFYSLQLVFAYLCGAEPRVKAVSAGRN